jgi:hypothetical protein
MWNEVIVAYFEVLSQHLSGEKVEKKIKTSQGSRQPAGIRTE